MPWRILPACWCSVVTSIFSYMKQGLQGAGAVRLHEKSTHQDSVLEWRSLLLPVAKKLRASQLCVKVFQTKNSCVWKVTLESRLRQRSNNSLLRRNHRKTALEVPCSCQMRNSKSNGMSRSLFGRQPFTGHFGTCCRIQYNQILLTSSAIM